MNNIKKICEEVIAAAEKATKRPWTPRVDSKEAWGVDSTGASRRHATFLYPTGIMHIFQGQKLCRPAEDFPQACHDADYTAISANHADKLARALLVMESVLKTVSHPIGIRASENRAVLLDILNGQRMAALDALARAEELLK